MKAPIVGLTVGSLCSGIGGFELGLEAAGLGPTLYQVEVDPYSRAVLARHWPDALRFEDLRHVAERPADLPAVDVIAGGTPCQDLSSAGKGAGLDGAKSSLWFAMLRVVQAKRPRFVVWENVPGCVRRGLDRVVGGLCDVGYRVVGTRVAAGDVGGAHRRERVLIVGYLADADGEGELQPERGEREERGRACYSGEPLRVAPWAPEPSVGRVAHGVPDRAHRLFGLGNALVPACAVLAGQLVADVHAGRVRL